MSADSENSNPRDCWLRRVLRMLAVIDLSAILVLFLPLKNLGEISQALGFDGEPSSPLVEYLIKATSVLYALHGALMYGMSADVVRYRPLIHWLGCLAVCHGGVMVGLDWQLGLPGWWCAAEGPVFLVCGTVVMLLAAGNDRHRPDSAGNRENGSRQTGRTDVG